MGGENGGEQSLFLQEPGYWRHCVFHSRLPSLPGPGRLQQADNKRTWGLPRGRFSWAWHFNVPSFAQKSVTCPPQTTKETGKCSLCAQEKKRKWVSESSSRLNFKILLEDVKMLTKLRAFIKNPNEGKPRKTEPAFSLNLLFSDYRTRTIKKIKPFLIPHLV